MQEDTSDNFRDTQNSSLLLDSRKCPLPLSICWRECSSLILTGASQVTNNTKILKIFMWFLAVCFWLSVGFGLFISASVVFVVDEALGHAYLSPHHDVAKEPVCSTPFSFDFEHPSCTEEHIKELIYKESVKFNPDH